MFCPKCNTKLKKNAKYCNNCDTKINSIRKHSEWSSFSSNKANQDNDYIRNYIGTDWNQNQFSIPAAIFGPFYLIYRKMHKEAFILIIVYITTYLYTKDTVGIIIRLLLNILTACIINRYYYKQAKKQTELVQKKNEDKEEKEVLQLCRKKGGTNSPKIIIIIFMIYLFIIATTSLEYKTKNIQQTTLQNNEMIYKVSPSTIIKTNHNNYQHLVDEGCYITVTNTKTNKTTKEYLLENKEYYTNYSMNEIIEKQVSDITWNQLYMENKENIQEIYVSKINETIYEIDFRYSKEQECSKKINDILDNIKIIKNN